MYHGRLFLSMVFGWAASLLVESRPTQNSAVELLTCGDNGDSAAVTIECSSVCQPIRAAQKCFLNAKCTCFVAPPDVVQACMQCHLNATEEVYRREVATLVPTKLNAYSQLCGYSSEASIEIDILPEAINSSLVEREVSSLQCIYGLPEVSVGSSVALFQSLASHKQLWPVYVVVILMVLVMLEMRS
ncbi:uncharacterized protein LAESUDRAFT_238860 [Laetiporus sulphureus 93-53]|uniref:Extracellular membrane protein CFEM domain-containing protein n=1 Tax=Laetiporus sulphureus 93-53 TaxID=1314785 RepID=A0A165DP40_9APHY|nr:uncharacterized protein LAESUDRAFT_238860 [Laetiporus sulphureus 93-53]KZT05312.1 hypothetical protein LAESUDRAFT_238860 [Laetiporus sulphureus 93-53]